MALLVLTIIELVLKLPKEKPPFIGVLYEMPQQTWRNHSWTAEEQKQSFQLLFEPSHDLILWLVKGSAMVRYSMTYDPLKLLKFLANTKDCTLFTFGCIYFDGVGFKPLKTEQGTQKILRIDKVSVVTDF